MKMKKKVKDVLVVIILAIALISFLVPSIFVQ